MHNSLCPKCVSENIYYSKKKECYVCEDCDHTFDVLESKNKYRLFFSYGHDENEPLVLRIKTDLEARGHTVWIDKSKIKSGDNWRKSIVDGLIDSSNVLAFLSRHSARNPGVCIDELKIAICVKGCDIKTVLLEKEEDVSPPSIISEIQWMDMSSWSEKTKEGKEIFEAWYDDKLNELGQVLENPDIQTFSGEIEQLRKILQPVILDEKEQMLLSKPYVGRVWLDDALENWLKNEISAKAFIVLGMPGTGKSAFAVNTLFKNPNAICGFLCQWDKNYYSSGKNVIRTLAFKLASKLPDYRKILLQLLKDIQINCKTEESVLDDFAIAELFSSLIINPLRHGIDGNRERIFIVLDGLDEVTGGGTLLAETLADNLLYLPKWISFVITSRPEPEISNIFRDFNPLTIDVSLQENEADIYNYLEQSLSAVLHGTNDKHSILKNITESSEGSFLYAELFAEDARKGTIDLGKSADYPRGLIAFYRQNLARKFPKYEDFLTIRDYLEIMLADEELPLEILIDVSGNDRYAYRKFRHLMGAILVEKKTSQEIKHLGFCHKSYADWLIDENNSGIYFVDTQAGYRKLALYASEILGKRMEYGTYLSKNITSYFVGAKLWSEYEKFLLDNDCIIPYDAPSFWDKVDLFPTNWNMDVMFEKLRYILDEPTRLAIEGTGSHLEAYRWANAFGYFARSISTKRLANLFFKCVWFPMGYYFVSSASDLTVVLKGYVWEYKVLTAIYLNQAVKRCKNLEIEVPAAVEEVNQLIKLTCVYHDGNVRREDPYKSYFYNDYKNFFADNICRWVDNGDTRNLNVNELKKLKQFFNTYCFAHELVKANKPDIVKLKALIAEGADVAKAKEISLSVIEDWKRKSSVLKNFRVDSQIEQAKSDLEEILFRVRGGKRWHPKPAKYVKTGGPMEDYVDIYQFECCGKWVLTDTYEPSQLRDDGCEIYEGEYVYVQ